MNIKPPLLVAALCSIMILASCAAGCTSSNTSTTPSASPTYSGSSVSGNVSAIAQPSSHEAVNISVRFVGTPQSVGLVNATPATGHKWYVYNVTIKDVNATDYLVMASHFMMNLSNGNLSLTQGIVNYPQGLGYKNDTTLMYTIQPGQTATGMIVFDVPNNVTPTKITYEKAWMNGTRFADDMRTFDPLAK